MLKPIPQEQPDFMPQNNRAGKNKEHQHGSRPDSAARQRSTNRATHVANTNLQKSNPKIVEYAGKKLIAYSLSPEKHSDTEIREIIHSMQRAIVHLQRRGNDKQKKKRRGK